MFYSQELAIRRQWDIMQVNYDYRAMQSTTQEARVQRMAVDCRAVMGAALSRGEHRRVILVGKSLGTIAMTTLLGAGTDRDVIALWLTPVIRLPEVREVMLTTAGRSAVVIGTRDDHYDAVFLDELRDRGAMIEVVEGGDHSLDIDGDVVASIGVLGKVIGRLDGFLADAVR